MSSGAMRFYFYRRFVLQPVRLDLATAVGLGARLAVGLAVGLGAERSDRFDGRDQHVGVDGLDQVAVEAGLGQRRRSASWP